MGAGGAASPNKLNKRALEAEAHKLRLGGLTYEQIAARQGCTVGAAYKRVMRALERHRVEFSETTEQLRAVEVARLEQAHLAAAALLTDEKKELRLKAVTAIVRVSERLARLLGLDAPAKIEGDLSRLTDEQLARIAAGEDIHAVMASAPAGDDLGALTAAEDDGGVN